MHPPAGRAAEGVTGRERRLHLGGIGGAFAAVDSTGTFFPASRSTAPADQLDNGTGAFAAVHIAGEGAPYVARLHCGAVEDEASPVQALRRDQLAYREDFPTAHFAVRDKACPLQVVSSVFSPIIPFDQDCSVLPLLFYCVRFVNRTSAPVDVSALFSWTPPVWSESLTPKPQPSIVAVDEQLHIQSKDEGPETPEESPNIVAFGNLSEDPIEGEDGGILGVYPDRGLRLSRCAWDPRDNAAAGRLWDYFLMNGEVPSSFMLSARPTHGVVCARLTLPAGEAYRVDFAVVWCRQVSDTSAAVRQRYLNQYLGPYPLARQALRFVEYYYRSIEDWQKRLANASLPEGMGRALVHTLNVLTSDVVTTDEDGWALPTDTPYTPLQRMILRLYSSIANAVLFPRFEEAEWDLFAHVTQEKAGQQHGTLARLLGLERHAADAPLALACQLISLYRNYRLTGGQVRVRKHLPTLTRQMMELHTFRGRSAFESGLWLAALRACGELVGQDKKRAEAAALAEWYQRALRGFDASYWDGNAQVYRDTSDRPLWRHDEHYCGQLCLAFFGDFLGWGDVLPPERVQQAVRRYHGPGTGPLAEASDDSLLSLGPAGATLAGVELAALSFPHGSPEAGSRRMAELVARAVDRGTMPAAEWLALWHLLFTVEGVFLDVAARTLRIVPHLPPDMESISAPLFTAVCLGRFRYKVDTMPAYIQQVRVDLDSPVALDRVEVFVPGGLTAVHVHCTCNDETMPVHHELRTWAGGQLLFLTFRQPIFLNGSLKVTIKDAARAQPD